MQWGHLCIIFQANIETILLDPFEFLCFTGEGGSLQVNRNIMSAESDLSSEFQK